MFSGRQCRASGRCMAKMAVTTRFWVHNGSGWLNTYVSWYRKNMVTEGDNPPVGILLCTKKDHALVEYALAGMDNGLFVSKYQLELPKKEEMQEFIEEQMKYTGRCSSPQASQDRGPVSGQAAAKSNGSIRR